MSFLKCTSDDLYDEPEFEDTSMRNKTLFQVLHESVVTKTFDDKEEDKAVVSSSYYCNAISNAIELIVNEPEAQLLKVSGKASKPSKTYVIKCATLLGLRKFQGYPRVKTILNMCKTGFNNKFATKEEQAVYRAIGDTKYVLSDLVRPFGNGKQSNRNIPVHKDVKRYVGDKCEVFKLTQSDMTMYFEVLGLLAVENPHLVYNEWIIEDLMKFKRLINERIYERIEEIERFNRHKDKSVFDDCLEYDGELRS